MHSCISNNAEGRSLENHDLYARVPNPPAGGVSLWTRIRRGLLVTIGAGCLVLGVVLMIVMVRPETLGTLGTAELFAIVALLVMPALTLLSLKYDQAVVKSTQRSSYQQLQSPSSVAHASHSRDLHAARHARVADPGDAPSQSKPTQRTHRTHDAA